MESEIVNLQKWEEVLSQKDFFGGSSPNKIDIDNYELLNSKTPHSDYLNVWKWYSYVDQFYNEIRQSLSEPDKLNSSFQSPSISENSTQEFDPSLNCNHKDAGGNEKDIRKLNIRIKPLDIEVNLELLVPKIFIIELEGLLWKDKYKLTPIGFGVHALDIEWMINPNKICEEDVTDIIEEMFEDEIHSAEIMRFHHSL